MATKFRFLSSACDGESVFPVKAAEFEQFMSDWATGADRAYGGFVTSDGVNVFRPGNDATEKAMNEWFCPSPSTPDVPPAPTGDDPGPTEEEFAAFIAEEAAALECLEEAICDTEQHCYEMEAENANEVAMFGDSGPGSACRVSDIKTGIYEMKKALFGFFPEERV